jgi:hypothetical protein
MQNAEGCAEMTGTEPHAWETSQIDSITYVGLDLHKATVCVALAEKLQAIVELDPKELQAIDLPRGYGRD